MYYVGSTFENILEELDNRFFYGINRSDKGDITLVKVDMMNVDDNVQINAPGDPSNNFNEFEWGTNFYEGRDNQHDLVYQNLNYEQYAWSDEDLLFAINDEGELTVRVNGTHDFGIIDYPVIEKEKDIFAIPGDIITQVDASFDTNEVTFDSNDITFDQL